MAVTRRFATPVVVGVSLFSFLVIGTTPAHAATALPNDQGVQISPTLLNVTADKGNTISFTLNVMNVTNQTLTFRQDTNDFNAKDETGTPSINLDSNLPSTVSIKSWVAPVAPFTLNPLESRKVTVSMKPPTNAEAGGHYGVIRFSGSRPEAPGNGVAVTASAGTLVLVRVPGNILEHISVKSFTTTDAKGDHQGLFEYAPVKFVSRLTNDGSVHLQPSGTIDISDMFGRPVTSLTVNDKEGYVLPSSTRRFESSTDSRFLFGRYSANLAVAYGTTGGAAERTVYFWVIPYRIIAAILVALAIVIIAIRFGLKAYIKRQVAKAKK